MNRKLFLLTLVAVLFFLVLLSCCIQAEQIENVEAPVVENEEAEAVAPEVEGGEPEGVAKNSYYYGGGGIRRPVYYGGGGIRRPIYYPVHYPSNYYHYGSGGNRYYQGNQLRQLYYSCFSNHPNYRSYNNLLRVCHDWILNRYSVNLAYSSYQSYFQSYYNSYYSSSGGSSGGYYY